MENTLNSSLNVSPLMHILNFINAPIIINTNNIFHTSFEDQGESTNPTNKDFIENLEKIEFNEDSEFSCGICLESFKKGEKAFILPCKDQKHYFHVGDEKESCEGILPWLQSNNTCPICREVFPLQQENDNEEIEEGEQEEEEEEEEEEEQDEENLIPIPEENFDNDYIEEGGEQEDNDDNEEENNDIPDTETIVQNFLDRIMEEIPQSGNFTNTTTTTRTIRLPLLNFIEAEEDYQLQQAIQRSITER